MSDAAAVASRFTTVGSEQWHLLVQAIVAHTEGAVKAWQKPLDDRAALYQTEVVDLSARLASAEIGLADRDGIIQRLERGRCDGAGKAGHDVASCLPCRLAGAEQNIAALKSDEAMRVAELRQAREGCAYVRSSLEHSKKEQERLQHDLQWCANERWKEHAERDALKAAVEQAQATVETEEDALRKQVGDCCGGGNPYCVGGCLVEKAIRTRRIMMRIFVGAVRRREGRSE